MKSGKIKNYFAGGNTTKGFYSLFSYLPQNMEKIYIIKGGPGTGKSTFMKKIGKDAVERGYDIEKHWCSSDNESLDGLVIPELKTAILDGTAPHTVDPVNPGAVDEIINLGIYWDSDYLEEYRTEIINLNEEISRNFKKTYYYLKLAKMINDEIEDYLKEGYCPLIASKTAEQLIDEIIPVDSILESGTERHLLGSGITPSGYINYFDNLTEDIDNRYLVRGKPGCGKSKLMKKIARTCQERGYFVTYLHCAFNPEKIDAVIINKLNTALINDTWPHTVKEKRENDNIINMMNTIDNDVLARNLDEINESRELLNKFMEKAFTQLNKAKLNHDELEKYYVEAMDFTGVENRRQKLLDNIMNNVNLDVLLPHQN